jgi:hypothetical protein
MLIGKPAPFVRTCIDAVDQAIRQDEDVSHVLGHLRWLVQTHTD